MPLGQGALGLSVCYALAIGYLVLMWLIGKVLTRQYPNEHKVEWNTRTIARITILAAVAGAGAMIKVLGPAATIALDAAAGYFAAGFLSGLLMGLPPPRCLVRGNACAALAIGKVGAREAMPTLRQLEAFLQARGEADE